MQGRARIEQPIIENGHADAPGPVLRPLPLQQAAAFLESNLGRRAVPCIAEGAAAQGISRGTLVSRLQALGEATLRQQTRLLQQVLGYIYAAVAAQTLEAPESIE